MSNPKLSELVSILYANVRIVILKGNHLMIHANAEKHDFILLSEFFINTQDKPQIAEVSLNGYDIFAKCRLHESGRGVLLYAKNDMKAVKISKTDVDAYDCLYV